MRKRVLDMQEFNELPTKAPDEGVRLEAMMHEEEMHRLRERQQAMCRFTGEDPTVSIAQEGLLKNWFGKKDHGPNGHSLELLQYLENKIKTGQITEEEIEYRATGTLAHLANKNKFEKAIEDLSTAMKMAKDFEQQMIVIWGKLIDALDAYSRDDDIEKFRKAYTTLAVAFKPNMSGGWHKGRFLKDSRGEETPHYYIEDSTGSYVFDLANNGTHVLDTYKGNLPAARVAREARWINEPYAFSRTTTNEYKHLFYIRKKDAESLQPKLLSILDEAIDHYAEYDSYFKKLDALASRMVDVHNRDKTRLEISTTQAIINRLCEAQGLMDATIFQTGSLIRQYVTLVY